MVVWIYLSKGSAIAAAPFARSGVIQIPELHLIPEDLAAYWTGRPASTIRRWAAEGRITRHDDLSGRKNGVRYDVDELPSAKRDENKALIQPAPAPPVRHPAANARGPHARRVALRAA